MGVANSRIFISLILGTLPATTNTTTQQGIFMKALIILSLTIVSLNAFSAEVGEDKKGECIYSSQSNKRDAKVVDAPESEIKKEAVKTMSK
jgi:hypothetical protein